MELDGGSRKDGGQEKESDAMKSDVAKRPNFKKPTPASDVAYTKDQDDSSEDDDAKRDVTMSSVSRVKVTEAGVAKGDIAA